MEWNVEELLIKHKQRNNRKEVKGKNNIRQFKKKMNSFLFKEVDTNLRLENGDAI